MQTEWNSIHNTGRLKTRDWKTRHRQKYRGGKHGTGKPGTKSQGWKTRDRKTRHQLAGVENEGINCMDSQWDNFCNLLK